MWYSIVKVLCTGLPKSMLPYDVINKATSMDNQSKSVKGKMSEVSRVESSHDPASSKWSRHPASSVWLPRTSKHWPWTGSGMMSSIWPLPWRTNQNLQKEWCHQYGRFKVFLRSLRDISVLIIEIHCWLLWKDHALLPQIAATKNCPNLVNYLIMILLLFLWKTGVQNC